MTAMHHMSWVHGSYPDFLEFKTTLFADDGNFPYLKPIASGNGHVLDRLTGPSIINMSGYDYLGLNQSPIVHAAAKAAIDRYGLSTSASRIVSGELDIHRGLETSLAAFLGAQDCVALVSGHGTNVTTVGHLFGPEHTMFCDRLVHNSVELGAKLAGAQVVRFRHNDTADLEAALQRHTATKPVVCIEGLYSMDGDLPPLPEILALKEKYGFTLYVDEAHSIGTVGATGRGICEHFDIDPDLIEIRMGTLSKTFASCGGYVVGSADLIEYLKFSSPGFIFSTGLPAPLAASALAALEQLQQHPEYVAQLHTVCDAFSTALTGAPQLTPIVSLPVAAGTCFKAARQCQDQGVRVFPITYPAVPRSATRFRFFLSRLHTPTMLRDVVDTVHTTLADISAVSA